MGKQSEAYAASIAAIRHVLRGRLGEVVRTSGQMAEAAEAFPFEEAEQYKRKLAAVKEYQAKNTIVHTGITEVEVYSIVLRRTVRLRQPEDPERHHHQRPHLGGAAQARQAQGNP